MKTRAMNPREMAIDIMATSTTKLTHPIILAHLTHFALASLKMRLSSLGAASDLGAPQRP